MLLISPSQSGTHFMILAGLEFKAILFFHFLSSGIASMLPAWLAIGLFSIYNHMCLYIMCALSTVACGDQRATFMKGFSSPARQVLEMEQYLYLLSYLAAPRIASSFSNGSLQVYRNASNINKHMRRYVYIYVIDDIYTYMHISFKLQTQ